MSQLTRQFVELPASDAQLGMWLVEALGEPSPLYTIPCLLRVIGEFDPAAARVAAENLVRRHESLRTVFGWQDGRLVQLVEEPADGAPVTLDFELLDVTPRDAMARAESEARRPFDLRTGPLLRVRVLRVHEREHLLLIAVHHIVSDGASLDLLLRELAAAYRGDALPGEPYQYGDFVSWQREWLTEPVVAELTAFWRTHLAGAEPLNLPSDRPRPPVQRHRGRLHRFTVPPALSAAARALAADRRVTLFTILYAVYHMLLARYARQHDVCVGVPLSTRSLPELREVAGLFVNNTVFRLDTSDDPTFEELIGWVREEFLDAAEHAELSFSRLVEELRPDRDLSRNPLFGVAFSVEQRPGRRLALGAATAERLEMFLGVSKFDLTLTCADDGQRLDGWWEYDTDLFDEATIAAMSGQYLKLLESAVGEPARRVSTLDSVGAAERRELTVGRNRTERDYPRDTTTSVLFGRQVAGRPDAPAVRSATETLSYRELDERANRVAHLLRAHGVGPDVPVAVCVERSVELLVAVLGVIKAGGAYLPLDPGHPAERRDRIVADAGAALVLDAATEYRARSYPATGPEPRGHARNLAYVIYTSGSTGVPKGVMVDHRALARLVLSADYVALRPGDVHLQLSPLTFDNSLIEVWGALLTGGTVALPATGMPFQDTLRDALDRYRPTTLSLTSPQLHLVAQEFPEALCGVEQLCVGGDVLSPAHAATILAQAPGPRLVHTYGPTESTLFATATRLVKVDTARATVPIGTPIPNTRAYILDAALRPAPTGVPGELWLGGDGLARGYRNRPALTAERFVPNPFGPPGDRLYRTGDLVRWLPSGQLEFLGRIDGQVKVRGYRIETGEVSAALLAHPAVREAAVVARDDLPGGRGLVAYLVSEVDAQPVIEELRAALRRRLPEYMQPAAFVWLDSIPLTRNGKVDRRGLPAPVFTAAGEGPRTRTEDAVRAAWTEVLGVPGLDRDAKFFDVGGNSLLLASLLEQLRARLPGPDLSLVELFEFTTIAEIAAVLDRRGHGQVSAPADLDI